MRSLLILVLATALPFSLRAQSSSANTSGTVSSSVGQPATATGDTSASAAASDDSSAPSDFAQPAAQQSKSPSTADTKGNKPRPGLDTDRPPIGGSMVGYIDNAVIGNEIRIRFDAGFDDNAPDRAEFFYAQCGCDGGTARGPKPGLVLNLNFQQLYIRAEYAPIKYFSAFVDVPVRWIQPQRFDPATIPSGGFGSQSGISDVEIGVKAAVVASSERYVTLQLVAAFPSGDSTRGLGTAHYTVSPSLLFFQRVTDRFSLEGQLGYSHPFAGDTPGFAGDIFTYGVGPSYELYRGERVRIAPVIEMVGWRVLGGKENNDAELIASGFTNPLISSDGTNIVNIKAGVRTSFGAHHSFYVGYGQAVTHDLWYKHIVRLEYRYSF